MKKMISIIVMVSILFAMAATVSAASFLEDEAGISASINIAGVNLVQAETAFKNIEKKTTAYIVGSVAIADYDESYDVHVYVDSSGHMVAYYLKSEPASKIIDWIHYTGGPMTLAGCKLEDALTTLCDAMSMTLPAVTYYDFRYPGAQQIKIVTDEALLPNASETFNVLIPGSHILYDCSWSHAIFDNENAWSAYNVYQFSIDSVILDSQNGYLPNGWNSFEGTIALDSMTPDVYHEILVKNINGNTVSISYAGIVLIYSETP